MKDENKIFVRKIGNVERNFERLKRLSSISCVPSIYHYDKDILDMEYIHGLDMTNYLLKYPTHDLIHFLQCVLNSFSEINHLKDYSEAYSKKLEAIDFSVLSFTKQQLIDKLPKTLPASNYHGDLTLDNIMYRMSDKKFILIDPLTSDYNSYVFDFVKLRQDLTCKWFIRNDNLYLDSKLQQISDALSEYEYFDNDYLLILMLIRILPYSKEHDREFIKKWIEKLWK